MVGADALEGLVQWQKPSVSLFQLLLRGVAKVLQEHNLPLGPTLGPSQALAAFHWASSVWSMYATPDTGKRNMTVDNVVRRLEHHRVYSS